MRKERYKKFGTTSLLLVQTRRWLEWEIQQHKKRGKKGKDDHDNDDEPNPKNKPGKKPGKKQVVYKEKDFKALCADPVFDSVETNLDASEVLIIKGDKFFVMESESGHRSGWPGI